MNTIYDINKINESLHANGYVVIPNVLNTYEIQEYIDEFNKWKNSIEYLDDFHNVMEHNGIFKYHQVGHQRFAWLVRTNPKIISIFKSIWNTDSLVTSFDGCCYYPSDYIGTPTNWIHSDQSALKKGRQCLQSFVSLTSNKERTFVVYEGSHKLHEDHSNIYNINSNSDWYMIEQEYIDTIENKKKILEVDAGSLVLWDSRTFHQNTCGTPTCDEERLVQYLCYLPKNNINNNEKTQMLRKNYFYNYRTTNHFPYPMSAIPYQPIIYNYQDEEYNYYEKYIDYESLQKPFLDDLIYKINNLL